MTDVDDRDEMAQVTWRARTASTVGVHIVSEIRAIVVSTPKISQIFAFFQNNPQQIGEFVVFRGGGACSKLYYVERSLR